MSESSLGGMGASRSGLRRNTKKGPSPGIEQNEREERGSRCRQARLKGGLLYFKRRLLITLKKVGKIRRWEGGIAW